MQDSPELPQLIASVERFLREEWLPRAADARSRFRLLVAMHVLGVAAREATLGAELDARELERLSRLVGGERDGDDEASGAASTDADRLRALNDQLVTDIREGRVAARPGTEAWAHLKATAIEKLRIANPAYLARVGVDPEARGDTR